MCTADCPCTKKVEGYDDPWVIPPGGELDLSCPYNASGTAWWSCLWVNDRYTLVPDQPDFSGCHSEEIQTISAMVNLNIKYITDRDSET